MSTLSYIRIEDIRAYARLESIELPDSEEYEVLIKVVQDHIHEALMAECLRSIKYMLYGPLGPQPFTSIYPPGYGIKVINPGSVFCATTCA